MNVFAGISLGAIAVVLTVAGVIVTAIFGRSSHARRREAFLLLATKLGLDYSVHDIQALDESLPFDLFTKGTGRDSGNLVYGTWKGIQVTAFDYWYYEEARDSRGIRLFRNTHRFSCATTTINASCPHVAITGETIGTRLADHMGSRDIEMESEEFNKMWEVRSLNRKFAYDLIDLGMMQWLLFVGKRWNFEVCGPHVLCYSRRLKPERVVLLLACLKQFVERFPKVVWDLYPSEREAP